MAIESIAESFAQAAREAAKKVEPDWAEIAEYARGTPQSEAEIAATFELSDEHELEVGEKINEEGVFNCVEGCGWWYSEDEMHNGDLCRECAEEQGLLEEDD